MAVYLPVLWTVLSPTGGEILPTWAVLTLLGAPVATLAALVGYGLRDSATATVRASLVAAGVVVPFVLALTWLVGDLASLLPGLLFAPAFAVVFRRERARGRPADVARTRGYLVVLFVVALAGLLASLGWLVVFLLAAVSAPVDVLLDLDTLALFGYTATGVVVDGFVCYRLARGDGRREVSRDVATLR